MSKWFRVVDPLSPLYGADVRGYETENAFGPDDGFVVEAIRRVDVFVGDRPFQLVAPEGEDLGVAVRSSHLQPSPIQTDVIEIDSKRPHGICLDESEMTRDDGYKLRIVRYETAVQVALDDPNGELVATRTFPGDPAFNIDSERITDLFAKNDAWDDVAFLLKQRN